MKVRRSGDGTHRVLFLHGGGVGGWMWTPLLDQLGAEVTAMVPDLPGHDANASQPYTSHETTVDALISLLDGDPSDPVTVVGFSLGAQLAVLLASRRPDLVARVCVISAQAVPMRGSSAVLGLLGLTSGLARRPWFARLQARELFIPDALMDDYLRTSVSLTKQTLITSVRENATFLPPAGWSDFPGQALILVGARERGLMRRSAQALHTALPASELEVVDGCGHGVPLQRPDWLAERLQLWWDPRSGA